MSETPTTIVIFGASGDLTRRKLVPALYHLCIKERLPETMRIVGVARRPYSDDDFREQMKAAMQEFAPESFDEATWAVFMERLSYIRVNLDNPEDYEHLREGLDRLEGGPANRLYYLSVAPSFYAPIVENLGAQDMVAEADGWQRIVVEKPFGTDLSTAQALNATLHRVFDEHQVYRIDHYLGKETAQNIMFLRFANTIFEPLWNRNYVDNVQITVTETVDVGHRAGYYDQSGVVRDMFQNHLLQLLALVAMEPPASFDADLLRNERVKVFNSVRPIDLRETVRAQYNGYRDAEGVADHSQTPTYAALKLYVDNWRWQGVPFYLRSGKALKAKSSEINIQFRYPPHMLFRLPEGNQFSPNTLSLCIQPDEGAHLTFEAKVPDSGQETRSVDMEFHYSSSFGDTAIPDAYERLLLDALNGDAALFARSDGIEGAWRLIDPVIAGWENSPEASALVTYEGGTWGPPEADDLLGRSSHHWIYGCEH